MWKYVLICALNVLRANITPVDNFKFSGLRRKLDPCLFQQVSRWPREVWWVEQKSSLLLLESTYKHIHICIRHYHIHMLNRRLTLSRWGGGPPSKICFKIGLMGCMGPYTHWLFLNMHEKWFSNVLLGRTLPGGPQGNLLFSAAPSKNSKINSFWARMMVCTCK